MDLALARLANEASWKEGEGDKKTVRGVPLALQKGGGNQCKATADGARKDHGAQGNARLGYVDTC